MWNATQAILYCKEKFNETSLQETCYLDQGALGYQEMAKMRFLGTAVYSVIFLTGILGNVSTCIVIYNHKSLRTSTNFYLFNLAVSDLITLIVGLPFEVYMVWRPYPWDVPAIFCHLKAWLSEATSYASVLTILAFSIERYLAICHPLIFMKFQNQKMRLRLILMMVWVIALVCAAPFGVFYVVDYAINVSPFDPDGSPLEQSKVCAPGFNFESRLLHMFEVMFHVSAALFFIAPLLSLIYMYRKVFVAVRNSRHGLLENSICLSDSVKQDFHSRRVLFILVAVISGFFGCYAPFQVQRLMFSYVNPEILMEINQYLFWISGFLFYFAATLNPIIYNVISRRYREAFSDVLCLLAKKNYYNSPNINFVQRKTLIELTARNEEQNFLQPRKLTDGRSSQSFF